MVVIYYEVKRGNTRQVNRLFSLNPGAFVFQVFLSQVLVVKLLIDLKGIIVVTKSVHF